MINAFQNIDENITIVRGDTLAFGIDLKQALDDDPTITEPFDQDLDACFFSVRKDYNNTENVFQKSIGNGIEKVEAGKYRVRIAPYDTESLEPGIYYYDCEIGLNGDYFTLLKGSFNIEPDITMRSATPINEQLRAIVTGTLTSVTAAEIGDITEIRQYAFYNCRSLISVEIPKSVTNIGNYAFQNCVYLQSVVLPDGLTRLGGYSFNGCQRLESINLPNSITYIGSAVFLSTKIKNLVLPLGVTQIENSAFFRMIFLETVDLHANVTSIGRSAFSACSNLTSFTCRAVTPPTIEYNTFENTNAEMNIYVPTESVDAYKAETYWRERAAYIQAIPS